MNYVIEKIGVVEYSILSRGKISNHLIFSDLLK